jgi:hypothetical protein
MDYSTGALSLGGMTASQVFGLTLAALMLTASYYAYRAATALLRDGRERRRYRALVDQNRAREVALAGEMANLEVGLALSDLDNELTELLSASVTTTHPGPVNRTKEALMTLEFDAAADLLRPPVDDPRVRDAAATLLVTLGALVDEDHQLREGPACRLKSGAVAAVAEHVADQFSAAGEVVKPEEILDALETAGLVVRSRDGEADVFTVVAPVVPA